MKQKFNEFINLMINLNQIGVEINLKYLFVNKNNFFNRDYSLKIIEMRLKNE